MSGTYVLVIDVSRSTTIDVGALGDREFTAGAYAYVGSAFGPGGFSRVDRHRELAAGDRETRHWHVDYLLGHPATRLEHAITFPDAIGSVNWRTRCPASSSPGSGRPTATVRHTCSPRRATTPCSRRRSTRVASSTRRAVPFTADLLPMAANRES